MATMPLLKPRRIRRPRRKARIGPDDDGRRMSLVQFAHADAAPGFNYELANGVVQVTDIPGISHHLIVRRLNRVLTLYDASHEGVIVSMGGGAEAKMELRGHDTERHPDVSIYLDEPPTGVEQPWDQWIPDIVIEVVSASSAKRDYGEKVRDYLLAGTSEYWIVDPLKESGLFLVRHADAWGENRLGPKGKWKTPRLPGFTLDLAKILAKSSRRK